MTNIDRPPASRPSASVTASVTASVIIPAYSLARLDDLLNAVESVRKQTIEPLEIIVAVDHNPVLVSVIRDSSTDVSAVLNDGIIGGAETRNAGIRAAQGDIVVFLDDDAWAEPDWLEKLIAAYEDQAVMAVGGKTISYFSNGRPEWFPEELDWLVGGTWRGHREDAGEVRNLIGPNMSFRRSVCATIGYMRPELGALPQKARAGDETEFYIRLKSAVPEGTILHEPAAIVHHKIYPFKSTVKYLIARSLRDGYFKSKTINTYKESSKKPFGTESSYLWYLLFKAIPGRLIRFYKGSNLTQVGALVLSILCFGFGYVGGMFAR